jgi:hypothetical protein
MYNRDEFVLKDGDRAARVHLTRGVKQGWPLSPCFFPSTLTIITTLLRGYQGLSPEPRVCTSHTCCMQMIWFCWLMSPVICKSCWVGSPECMPEWTSDCQHFSCFEGHVRCEAVYQ